MSGDIIRLATPRDAPRIGDMSRDLVEAGLPWSWTATRIARSMRAADTNVVVSVLAERIVGMAIMQYLSNEAHLNLLAVSPDVRRQGIGTRLILWLEQTAVVNGSGVIYLETRYANHTARRFYESLGYAVVQQLPRYYAGRESALRMARDLWLFAPSS